MKSTIGLILLLLSSLVQAGESKIYNVKGNDYEGYWAKVSDSAIPTS
jgi:hypothetical protein